MEKLNKKEKAVYDAIINCTLNSDHGDEFCVIDAIEKCKEEMTDETFYGYLSDLQKKELIEMYDKDECYYDGMILRKNYDMTETENLKIILDTTKEITFEMIKVKGNENLDDYYIGKYLVTQGLWEAIMNYNPSYFQYYDNYPVENVSWNDIVNKFLPALNTATGKTFALPTETQWEWAAKGGIKSKGYRYSGSDNIDDIAWYYDNSSLKTHPVGEKEPNELGIYDMIGNVWEWTSEKYNTEFKLNPRYSNSVNYYRILRGGCWCSYKLNCQILYKYVDHIDNDKFINGFRLVMNTK